MLLPSPAALLLMQYIAAVAGPESDQGIVSAC